MDVEERVSLLKSIAVEVVRGEELKILLETNPTPVAYDGFEPSGFAHLPLGVYRPLLLRDLIRAGVKFKLLLADTFAWINNKLGGDIDKIREAARYFVEVWRVAGERFGVDYSAIEVVWHKDFFDDPEYWRKVMLIAKSHTLQRTARALTIAGRVAKESHPAAFFFYPSMQCADIFHLKADICQLGLDQRKVNILAREVAQRSYMGKPLYKWLDYEGHGVEGRPVLLHHRMLPSLEAPQGLPAGFDEDAVIDASITWKMSKSKPESSIFIHDPPELLREKIIKAFCPPKSKFTIKTREGREVTIENPVLVYVREIVFRALNRFEVVGRREETYFSFEDLVKDYDEGRIHPLDLKESLSLHLNEILKPIREHFESGPGRQLYERIKEFEITR